MTLSNTVPGRWLGRSAVALAATLAALSAQAQDTYKVGIVSFLSGQAAESFGIPAVNGAKVLLDAFNKGGQDLHGPQRPRRPARHGPDRT